MNKLIQTKNYLLLINEEAEIKEGYAISCIDDGRLKQIIAYYPLTKEAKELNLPLLPNPFKTTDVAKLSCEATKYQKFAGGIHEKAVAEIYFRRGYKAAQSDKQFSLEDMRKAIEYTHRYGEQHDDKWILEQVITQQLPKEFIPIDINDYDDDDDGLQPIYKKTITSKGKPELVGTYKY